MRTTTAPLPPTLLGRLPAHILEALLSEYLGHLTDIVTLDTAAATDPTFRPIFRAALSAAITRRCEVEGFPAHGVAWANARGIAITRLVFPHPEKGHAALCAAVARGLYPATLGGLTDLELMGDYVLLLDDDLYNDYKKHSSHGIDDAVVKALTSGQGLQHLTWDGNYDSQGDLYSKKRREKLFDGGYTAMILASPMLTHLTIHTPAFSEEALSALAATCQRLQSVEFDRTLIRIDALAEAVICWPMLECLKLRTDCADNTPYDDDAGRDTVERFFAALADHCPQLTCLELLDRTLPAFREEGPWPALARLMRQLKEVILEQCQLQYVPYAVLDALTAAGPNMESLCLFVSFEAAIDDIVMKLARSCPRLHDLHLGVGSTFQPATSVALLRGCPRLKMLPYGLLPFDGAHDHHVRDLVATDGMYDLETLSATNTHLTAAGLRALGSGCMPRLHYLRLGVAEQTVVRADDIRALVDGCFALREVILVGAAELDDATHVALVTELRGRGVELSWGLDMDESEDGSDDDGSDAGDDADESGGDEDA